MAESLCLEWENLNLQVKKRSFHYLKCKTSIEEKQILINVNGHIESGQLVAILGSSGAGKTSLLAAISKRYRGPIGGRILLNGEPINRRTMTKLSCFVPQFDITIASLTPTEHLYFMGELKLDRRWTRTQKDQRIQVLLRQLGLQRMANTRISSLSGGERKRLNVATDLLTNPPLLFCDEPTTGLDSYNALSVVKCLQQLTREGSNGVMNSRSDSPEMEMMETRKVINRPKAILCSIHQPTSETFRCFSHIILMYAGRAVFQGTRDAAIDYFSSLGFHCPSSYNPADYYLNILSSKADSQLDLKVKVDTKDIDFPLESLRNSFEYRKIDRHLMKPIPMDRKLEHNNIIWLKQFWILLRRACLRSSPSWRQALIILSITMTQNFVIALCFRNVTTLTQESIQDIRGAFFMIVCEIVFSSAYNTLQFYPSQMPLLRRETNEHIYKFSAFFVAEMIWRFLMAVCRNIALLTVSYLIFGFVSGITLYFQLALAIALGVFTSNAYGFMLTGLFESGREMASVISLIFQIFGGFFINLNSFPYLRYTSVFFFLNEAMTIFFWHDVTDIECSVDRNNKCLRNGTEVLEEFSYNTTFAGVYYDLLGLICLATIMNTAAYLGIRRFIRGTGYY